MKIKISEKIICIPPYISTTWDQIAFLQSQPNVETGKCTLLLHLANSTVIKIPELDHSLVEIAFSAHIQYLEKAHPLKMEEAAQKNAIPGLFSPNMNISPDQIAAFQIKLASGNPMEGLENAFQHNPNQANTPQLPKELIEKIAAIAKILTNGDTGSFPKPEPHCNCVHCQVARSIHNISQDEEEKTGEDEVTEEDLKFRSWEILQTSDKLYTVTNPIDPKEQYNVYLGSPVGCTCGHSHCEHIKAVLSS